MKKIIAVLLLSIFLASSVFAYDDGFIKIDNPNIYVDANGWQPYKPATNLMLGSGIFFGATGLVWVFTGETQVKRNAGWIGFGMGVVLTILRFAIPKSAW